MKTNTRINRIAAVAVMITFVSPLVPLSAATLSDSVGSFKIAADLSRRSSQELAVKQAANIIAVASATLDPDGDGFPEAPVFVTGSGPPGGGLVPTGFGAPVSDGYGGRLGYCVWDNGSVVTGGVNRLAGSTTNVAAPAFAVVSAGLDGVFNRTCAQIAAGAVTTDDDFVVAVSTMQIRQGVGGTVYFGDPVASVAALNALNPVTSRDGELRLVRADNTLWRWNSTSSAWVTAASSTSLSSLAAASAANLIDNAANAQRWNWQLSGNTTGFAIAETAASTGGSGSQYLHTIGTLAGSSAIALSVAVRGVEAFRVDSVNPQIVANAGTVAAPSYAFAGAQGTGLYLPTSTSLGAAIGGVGALKIDPVLYQTSVGYGALPSATGINNIAFGHSGLAAATTGNQNIAIGNFALQSLSTAAGNTAIGNFALQQNNGNANTAVGNGALALNTVGINNTGLGSQALGLNTIGSSNMAIGISAAYNNISGNQNIAIGDSAFYGNTTGTGNTVIGTNALNRNTTGFYNVAIGANFNGVPANAMTGYSNTFIGTNAMTADTAAMAASGRITLIGADSSATGLGIGAANAYMTAIGSGAVVSTLNTVVLGRPFDKVVIGSTGDDGSGAALQVAGGVNVNGNLGVTGSASIGGNINVIGNSITGGQILAANGTVTSPGIAFNSERGMGFYRAGAGQLAASIGGVRSMYLNGSSVGLGAGALSANTTGVYNTAVGSGTLQSNTTGNYNVANGANALQASVNGWDNVATGYKALYSNISGDDNVATGLMALYSNTSGGDNVATGSMALYSNTTGSVNVANGNYALYNNTTGSYNVATGYSTMYRNTTGDENTAYGWASLYWNSTGSRNTGVGQEVLRYNTTGNNNVGSGYLTLYNNTTGSNNVASGYLAGYTNNSITSANSTFIGANATIADNVLMAASGRITLLGADASASGLGAANANAYMTALGSGASVTTANTVVLGRAADMTVIGATGDDGTGNRLQVTGNIKGSGNLTIGGTATFANTLTLAAGTTTVAPLNLQSGVNLTTPAFGAIEFDGTNLYLTNNSGAPTRKTIAYTDSTLTGSGAGLTNLNGSNITSGTVGVAYGGTGLNGSAAANGTLLIGNGSGYTLSTLTGTANQVIVTNAAGSITLSLPQSIAITSTPTFGGLTVNGNLTTTGQILAANGTVAAPSIAFTSEPATGFYRVGTGQLAASVGGVRGLYLTSGSVGLGVDALSVDVTPGGNNTAVGNLAARKNNGGTYNTAVGYDALNFNIVGNYNTAVGKSALRVNTSTGNTAVGDGALTGNLGGSLNVALGRRAGYATNATNDSTNANVSGSNNTFLGSFAMPGTTTQLTYATVLGSEALITTPSTIVLGRAGATPDVTVIGATGDDGSGNRLQVTGNIKATGNLSIGSTGSFANTLTLAAGSTVIAPLKLQTGVNLTTPAFGAVEFDGTNLYLTNNSGTPTRKTIAFTDSTLTGNAATATKLATARTIAATGDASWSVSFDGSANVTSALTLASSGVTAATYGTGTQVGQFTVDAKGRITSAANVTVTPDWVNITSIPAQVSALGNLATNGLITRTVAGTLAARTLTAGSTKVSVVNGDGVAGNPTIDIAEANVSLNNLGGTLGVAKGGTGATSLTGYVYGNGTAAMTASTTIPGAAISGNITGNATNITAYTINQNLGTTDSPTHAGLTLNGNLAITGQILAADGTLAAPGIAFGSEPGTGLYRFSAGQLTAAVTGTRSMLLTSLQTSFGYGAMAGTPGAANTAIGVSALGGASSGANNTAVGFQSMQSNGTGANNSAFGKTALKGNTTGGSNVAMGVDALLNNNVGSDNVAIGMEAVSRNAVAATSSGQNVGVGTRALYRATGGTNTGLGYFAGQTTNNNLSGTNSTFVGANATVADTAAMSASGYITAIGASATASGLAALNANAYMTALGAGSSVTTINTVVLGRAGATPDTTVIGATADDLSNYRLQVTGGIKALTGGMNIAGGDMVLGSANITGTFAARPAPGVANRIFITNDTNAIYRDTGSAWVLVGSGSAGSSSLSGLTAATATNSINNGAFGQTWNWQLTADGTTAFNLTENAASTGGAGAQFLTRIGTLSGSTAIPLSVSALGVETFRVNSNGNILIGSSADDASGNKLQVAGGIKATGNLTAAGVITNAGTAAAPSHTFVGNTTTGFYLPAAGQLGASLASTRAMFLTSSSLALGNGALNTASSGADNIAIGRSALAANTTAASNVAIGAQALKAVTNNGFNVAVGTNALLVNTGDSNTALGSGTLIANTIGTGNVAVGRYALDQNTIGSGNAAIGDGAGTTITNLTSADNSVFMGSDATIADTVAMAGSGRITLLGAGTRAQGLGAATANAYMTALGSQAAVSTVNTVVLGRVADVTVIGATGDDGSGNKLQVTGGIKALSGGVNVSGGDLVLGSASITGTLAARPAFGVANRLYITTDTNAIYRDTGAAWVPLGSAGSSALSSLTAATASNTLANAAFDQNWNWQLTGNTAAFSIGESAASTGGSGTQYLTKIGTLATSTAIPLSVSSQGTEVFRVSNISPQIVAAVGSKTAPTYSFTGQLNAGFYLEGSYLAATVLGNRGFLISQNAAVGQNALKNVSTGTANVAMGTGALQAITTTSQNVAIGDGALAAATAGSSNTAIGDRAGGLTNNYQGSSSVFLGAQAAPVIARLSTSDGITLLGALSAASLSSNPAAGFVYMTAIGAGSSVTSVNTVVLGRASNPDSVVIGATGTAASGNAAGKTLQVTGTVGVTGSVTALSYVTSSDRRLKENIAALDRSDTLQRLKALNGYSYNLIADPNKTPTYGVIAQEILKLFPDTVRVREDGFYAVDYGALSALTATAVGQLAINMDHYGLAPNGGIVPEGGLMIGNGKSFTLGTLTADTGISVVNTAGHITIKNTGVTGFNGRTGNVTLGLADINAVTSFGNGNYTTGTGALAATSGGSFNTAVGQGALGATGDGTGNSAQGYQALLGNTSGANNVAIGRQAGYANRAGISSAANVSGSNNTFLGAYAMPGASGQLNYATAIGADAIVSSSDTIVLGRASDVTVIGAAADDRSGSRLQVTGNIKATGQLMAHGLTLTTAPKQGVWIGNGAAAGSGNGLVQKGDSTMLFSQGSIDGAAGMVIGPWTGASNGLRVATSGVSVGGALTVNGPINSSTGYAMVSDARFKKNIDPIKDAIAVISKLEGVRYEFDRSRFPDRNFEGGRQLGLIAQQVEPILPELVRTDAEGYKSLQYSQLAPLLIEGIKAQQAILKHLVKKDPTTLTVDIKTFQGNDAVFENIKSTNIKTANLEAETARIKKLEAERIESKFIRSDVVKSGEAEVFVSVGTFQPIFSPQADSQYIVNVTAEDGSSAFASVAFMSGKISVTPISGKGIDVTAMGAQVGLVAASKKVKATWIRMS